MNNAERRKESRVPSQGVLPMNALVATAEAPPNAKVIDVSRSGLQIELNQPIALATSVELEFKGITVLGAVANCRQLGKGRYRVGIVTTRIIDSVSA
jgi:hypothetical protein